MILNDEGMDEDGWMDGQIDRQMDEELDEEGKDIEGKDGQVDRWKGMGDNG